MCVSLYGEVSATVKDRRFLISVVDQKAVVMIFTVKRGGVAVVQINVDPSAIDFTGGGKCVQDRDAVADSLCQNVRAARRSGKPPRHRRRQPDVNRRAGFICHRHLQQLIVARCHSEVLGCKFAHACVRVPLIVTGVRVALTVTFPGTTPVKPADKSHRPAMLTMSGNGGGKNPIRMLEPPAILPVAPIRFIDCVAVDAAPLIDAVTLLKREDKDEARLAPCDRPAVVARFVEAWALAPPPRTTDVERTRRTPVALTKPAPAIRPVKAVPPVTFAPIPIRKPAPDKTPACGTRFGAVAVDWLPVAAVADEGTRRKLIELTPPAAEFTAALAVRLELEPDWLAPPVEDPVPDPRFMKAAALAPAPLATPDIVMIEPPVACPSSPIGAPAIG